MTSLVPGAIAPRIANLIATFVPFFKTPPNPWSCMIVCLFHTTTMEHGHGGKKQKTQQSQWSEVGLFSGKKNAATARHV